ncbi:hypothetical protein [Pedobacter chitinilyticus]|uniref:Lipoprotein n=1 Tax=Pedobacter chitinilyticus TaxID=2233776 RepID=A0A3S3SU53_9SPHI|nr:hypothetical protein [Pedobacter chitinilyticus]RWU07453.1 hypothetical protein DPV69_10705 [Pedobacter chitinilyticus]
MKKSILLGLGFGIMMFTISSCGIMLHSTQNNSEVINNAIAKRDINAIVSLNSSFEKVYNHYANSDIKKEKVAAFVGDMVANIEKKEPGSIATILLMLNSKDQEMVALGMKSAADKFDAVLMEYAGTLEHEAIFKKVFNEY